VDSGAALQLKDLENCLEMELDGCRRYFSKILSTRDWRSLAVSEGGSYTKGGRVAGCFGKGNDDFGNFVAMSRLLVLVSRTHGRMYLYNGGF